MRRPLGIAVILSLPLAAHPVRAELAPLPPELESLADVVMANRPPAEVARADAAAEEAIGAIPDETSRTLHDAQRLFLLGFDAIGRGNTSTGEAYVEQSMEAARDSLAEHESSEGYRILADGYNQLLKVRGRAYQMFHFRSARDTADRAVELDRRNPLAHVSAASY